MFKKAITFEDLDGNTVIEDHYFHLNKAELIEMEMSVDGGLSETLTKIIETKDGKQIIAEFKKIILGSYGKRSEDGRRFIKNQELRDEFESSEAYSTLFMELVTDEDSAAEFVNGMIPQNLAEEAAKIASADLSVVPNKSEDQPKPEHISRAEVETMSSEEAIAIGQRVSKGEVVIVD